ncbi:MAG: CDP-alcohol phosphatidyltransferase family protein [Myxococcota bacterium]
MYTPRREVRIWARIIGRRASGESGTSRSASTNRVGARSSSSAAPARSTTGPTGQPSSADIDPRGVAARDTRWADAATRALVAAGIGPNTISAASVGFGIAAGALLAWLPGLVVEGLVVEGPHPGFVVEGPGPPVAAYLGAGLAIQGRLLCNLFDGMVAVEGNQKGATGELWNDLPDRLSDTAILVGAGYGCGLPWLGWLAAVVALHVAYVRVLGAASGTPTFFVGPMAKQHRMAALTVACAVSVFHPVIDVALGVIVAGGIVTAVRRLWLAAAALRGAS